MGKGENEICKRKIKDDRINDMETTPSKNWIFLLSRICLWAWIIYFVLLIPISIISASVYIAIYSASKILAILLIFPIIGIIKPGDAKRSYFVKVLLLSLFFSILVNFTLIIGASIAHLFGYDITKNYPQSN